MSFKNSDLLKKILQTKEKLTKKQEKLTDYIIENYTMIPTFTLKQLSESSGVGISTIIRTIQMFGFTSYNDFKKEVHNATLEFKHSTWWPLENTASEEHSNQISQYLKSALTSLQSTFTNKMIFQLNKLINAMGEAEHIYIFGLRSSKIPAHYLYTSLLEFCPKVRYLSDQSEYVYDRLLHATERDLIIFFLQSPFSVDVMEVAEFCHESNIKIALITDLLSCPIVPIATINLLIETEKSQFTLLPTVALVELIIIQYGVHRLPASAQHLEHLGDFLVSKGMINKFKGFIK